MSLRRAEDERGNLSTYESMNQALIEFGLTFEKCSNVHHTFKKRDT